MAGLDMAGQLLVTARAHPEPPRSESGVAHRRGVALIPTSSAKTSRLRLNRSGNGGANHALSHPAMVWRSYAPAT